jgi:hypothetical protein
LIDLLARARKVLVATERRSLQLIHRKEFLSRSATKQQKSKTPKGRTTTPEMRKGLDAYDQIKAAGHQPTIAEVETVAGISNVLARPGRRAPDRSHRRDSCRLDGRSEKSYEIRS